MTDIVVPNPVQTDPARRARRPRPGRRPVLAAAILAAAVPVLVAFPGGLAAALGTTTTSSSTPETTTSAPVTTTTTAPTTTTSAPVTTTTRARPTTTTSSSSTTTTTTAPASTSASKTWGWVLLVLVVALAVALVALLIARSRRQGREVEWEHTIVPVVVAAELARDLVLGQTPADDQQRRGSVAVQVDEAVDGLERAAASAPDPANGALCTRSAESLRGLAFAVEADHLLRSGGQNPTGEQLASADAARRNRTAELQSSLQQLRAVITPKR